jgi:hypothetical protein
MQPFATACACWQLSVFLAQLTQPLENVCLHFLEGWLQIPTFSHFSSFAMHFFL